MTTPGSALQSKVLKYLQEQGVFCWRQNNQPTHDPRMNNGYGGYRAHNGLKGVPDIIAVIDGIFVGFEIKAGKDRISPDQLFFKRRLERNGGKYFVIRSVNQAKKELSTVRSE